MTGLINFEYTLPLSQRRERFLVTYLENETVAEILKTQALLTAHLMPMSTKEKNVIKDTFETYSSYSEILLPTSKKQAKLKDMSHKELQGIKDSIAKNKTNMIKVPNLRKKK